jgi:hypothetical protein
VPFLFSGTGIAQEKGKTNGVESNKEGGDSQMSETIQYLTEVSVAEITGRALSTLRNDRSIGRGIPYIKIGRSVRYDINDVVRFMEAHKIRTEDSVYLDDQSSREVLNPRRADSLSNDAPRVEGGWNGPHIRGQKSLSRSCSRSLSTQTTLKKEKHHG